MLKLNDYYIHELEYLMGLFTNIFEIIDDTYNEILYTSIKNKCNIKDSKLSDGEIITIIRNKVIKMNLVTKSHTFTN